jgi:hypothetical protein
VGEAEATQLEGTSEMTDEKLLDQLRRTKDFLIIYKPGARWTLEIGGRKPGAIRFRSEMQVNFVRNNPHDERRILVVTL